MYQIEIRNTTGTGELVAVLENAYKINYVKMVNAPHLLKFCLPADDAKIANITLANEYWLRNVDTDAVVRKFKLQTAKTVRRGSVIEIEVECLDYMSQLSSGVVIDYEAGVVMTYITQSPDYGGAIQTLAEDALYVYAGGDTTQTIRKYLKSDLSLAAESPGYGGTIYALVEDSIYIYAGGGTTQTIRKYLKSTLAYVTQSPVYGIVLALAEDDNYIYAGGFVTDTIRKYLKSDLSLVAESPDYGGIIYTLIEDALYVYAGGATTQTIRRYLKSDLSYVAESPGYGGTIETLAEDDIYIYAGGDTTNTIRKYLKSDLSLVAESPGYGGTILRLLVDDIYVYAGGTITQTIRRYLKSDLSYVAESPDYGGAILALTEDSIYIYAGGGTTNMVRKYSMSDTIDEVIDTLLTYPMQLPAVIKGTIDATYADLIRTIKASGQSILKILLTLQAMVGGYLEVDNDRELNWAATIGEDKGQQIRYRKNLLGIEREVDYVGFYNRIYAYGQTTAGAQIKLSEIQAEDYVEDAASQAAWGGIYAGMFVNFSIISAASLLEWANDLLAQYKDPLISYRIDAIDLSVYTGFSFDTLQLGSTVTVIDEDLGIDVSATVVKIDYPDLSNPQDMIIELTNFVRNAADSLATLSSVQKDLLLAA